MKFIDKNLENYCIAHSEPQSKECEDLAKKTHNEADLPQMLVGPLEASFLGFLIKSINAKRVLEIGRFTGYSALAIAEHLPENGEIITLDITDYGLNLAEEAWNKSSVGKKIKSIIGPALETIPNLKGDFDLVFIDADKENYTNYVKAMLPKLSKKGIMVLDNCLWSGKVIDHQNNDDSTKGIREVNEYVSNHPDLYASLLPVRDGMLLVKKR